MATLRISILLRGPYTPEGFVLGVQRYYSMHQQQGANSISTIGTLSLLYLN